MYTRSIWTKEFIVWGLTTHNSLVIIDQEFSPLFPVPITLIMITKRVQRNRKLLPKNRKENGRPYSASLTNAIVSEKRAFLFGGARKKTYVLMMCPKRTITKDVYVPLN